MAGEVPETAWVAVGAPRLPRHGRPAGRRSWAWDHAQSPALAGAGAGRANIASGTTRISHSNSEAAFQLAEDSGAGIQQTLDAPPGQPSVTEVTLRRRRELVLICHTRPPGKALCLFQPIPRRLLARCSYRLMQALCTAGPLNHSLKGCISFTFR